jgi:hypothetical protein
MIMATGHFTVKARSGRNRPRKSPGTHKSANRSKAALKRRKSKPTPAAPPRPGLEVTERGVRIRVRGRLQEMIRAEMLNLEKAESVLRCLMLAMEFTDTMSKGVAYFPDVVEVAGDLVQRSIVDLGDLDEGRIPNPLMATLKVER